MLFSITGNGDDSDDPDGEDGDLDMNNDLYIGLHNHHHESESLPLLFLQEEFPLPCLLITHQRPGPAKEVCHAFITLDFSGYLRFI